MHVDQGSRLTVEVRNDGDMEATVHWHGLRVENRYDGVPFETQAPIPVGGHYTQHLQFPDAGVYWYHPHIREDYGLELGLYGTVVVEPSDPSYWAPADRFLTLTLDDLLVEDHKIAPFLRSGPTYTAMGRFGNVMLANGDTAFVDNARVGEVVRMYLVNCANTRIFKFGIAGARMKLVGGDSGRHEHESFVDDVLLAPSERAVVDVLFDTAGDARLEHRTPEHTYDLGTISVSGGSPGVAAASFDTLRTDPALTALRREIGDELERPPDKTLAFWSEMPLLYDQRSEDRDHLSRVPDARGDRRLIRGDLPQVRHEARPRRSGSKDADAVRVPDARRDHRFVVSAVPTVRDDAPVRGRGTRRHGARQPRRTRTPVTRRSNGKTTWSQSTVRPTRPT